MFLFSICKLELFHGVCLQFHFGGFVLVFLTVIYVISMKILEEIKPDRMTISYLWCQAAGV